MQKILYHALMPRVRQTLYSMAQITRRRVGDNGSHQEEVELICSLRRTRGVLKNVIHSTIMIHESPRITFESKHVPASPQFRTSIAVGRRAALNGSHSLCF